MNAKPGFGEFSGWNQQQDGKKPKRDTCLRCMRFIAMAWALAVLSIVILADTQHLSPVLHVIAMVKGGDKIAHFVLMGGLAATVSLAMGWSGRREPMRSVALGSVGVLVLVTLEELSQRWIAWRTFDLMDFGADVLGIGLGAMLAFAALTSRRSKVESCLLRQPPPQSPAHPRHPAPQSERRHKTPLDDSQSPPPSGQR